jgi:hypothetical protein
LPVSPQLGLQNLSRQVVPQIPLFDANGAPLSQLQTWLTVQGIMWLPNDLDSVLSYRTLGTPGQPVLSNLFKDSTLRLSKNATGGTIAANVFIHLLQLKIHRPADASLNKAAFLISRLMEKLPAEGKRRAPANQDNIHKFWNDFRRAAHLWGAAKWLSEMGLEPEKADDIGAFAAKILVMSDHLLRAAAKVGWEFDSDSWILPDSYPRTFFDFSLPPPRREVVELLKEYRSPNRSK